MVALSLLAVLAALAAPSFQSQLASSRLSATTNEVLGSLTQARTLAIRLGSRVTMCRSTSATDCDNTSGATWSSGWIIFQDAVRSGTDASVAGGDTVHFRQAAAPPDISVQGSGNAADFVSFAADGQSKAMSGSIQPGKLRVCSRSRWLDDNSRARDLQISANGRIAVEQPHNVANSCPLS